MAKYSNCSQSFKNTGENACKDKMIQVAKILFTPDVNFSLPAVSTLDALMDAIQEGTKSQRLYPLPLVTGMTDNSEDWKTGTTGYGNTVVLGDGAKSFTFEVPQDVDCIKRVRSLNNKEGRVYLMDGNGVIQCEEGSNGELYGYRATLFTKQGSLQDGQNIANGSIMMNLTDATAYEDRTTFVDLGISSSEVFGLTDVRLVGNFTGVKIMNDFTNEDVSNNFATATSLLQPGAWVVDGSVYSGTVSFTGGKFVFGTAPTSSLTLAAPDVLHALASPVDGIECSNTIDQ